MFGCTCPMLLELNNFQCESCLRLHPHLMGVVDYLYEIIIAMKKAVNHNYFNANNYMHDE